MERSKVILLPCANYDEEAVYAAVRQGLTLLGGLRQFVSPEEHILIKPNLLKNAAPEKAVTTHPSVFAAMLRCLREEGYEHLSYGDSPGPGPGVDTKRAAEEAGLTAQAERYGVPLGDFSGATAKDFPAGKTCKRFMLANEVVKADAVISLCKMKTHALENITGAVKNQYGCIYGSYKAAGHAMYPNSRSFADMLCGPPAQQQAAQMQMMQLMSIQTDFSPFLKYFAAEMSPSGASIALFEPHMPTAYQTLMKETFGQ